MAMNSRLMISATAGSSYDSRSITWHQWHHTAPMSKRMGLFSCLALANASSPHSCHWMGWCMAERRYEDADCARALVAVEECDMTFQCIAKRKPADAGPPAVKA